MAVDNQNIEQTESQQFSQAGKHKKEMAVLLGATGFFAFLGLADKLLDPLTNWEFIVNHLGRTVPEVLRKHGGDLANTPLFILLGMNLFYIRLVSRLNEIEKRGSSSVSAAERDVIDRIKTVFAGNPIRIARSGALFGMAISTLYMFDEWSRIVAPPVKGEMNLPHLGSVLSPRGDWGDVLAFSVPFIAGAIFFAHDLSKAVFNKVSKK